MIECKYTEFLNELYELTDKAKGLTEMEKHWINSEAFCAVHDYNGFCNCKDK